MPVTTTTKFQSLVFDKQQRQGALTRGSTRIAKRFKEKTRRAMIDGPHTGHLYPRPNGNGFRRFHRASARGERPSPDTMNLVNSVQDRKISDVSHEVFVDDEKAPYGKWLQSPRFDRKILTQDDVEEYESGEEFGSDIEMIADELFS